MTDGVLNAIEDWTGFRPASCPWFAFHDEFVQRCIQVEQAYEHGGLQWVAPNPSHKLVQGVTFYHRVSKRVEFKQWEEDRKNEERNRAAPKARGK